MNQKEAINKYGENNWLRMQEYLEGITIRVLSNGESNFYEDDLEIAFRASKGEEIAIWD